jgi:hypothetical protein
MLASMPFSVDGRLIAKLKNGYYCKLDLPAGDHTFTRPLWEGWGGPQVDAQRVHLVAGQTLYFCNFQAPMWTVFEVADDQEDARQSVGNLRQQNLAL